MESHFRTHPHTPPRSDQKGQWHRCQRWWSPVVEKQAISTRPGICGKKDNTTHSSSCGMHWALTTPLTHRAWMSQLTPNSGRAPTSSRIRKPGMKWASDLPRTSGGKWNETALLMALYCLSMDLIHKCRKQPEISYMGETLLILNSKHWYVTKYLKFL